MSFPERAAALVDHERDVRPTFPMLPCSEWVP
jgi:hypothetical protein